MSRLEFTSYDSIGGMEVIKLPSSFEQISYGLGRRGPFSSVHVVFVAGEGGVYDEVFMEFHP